MGMGEIGWQRGILLHLKRLSAGLQSPKSGKLSHYCRFRRLGIVVQRPHLRRWHVVLIAGRPRWQINIAFHTDWMLQQCLLLPIGRLCHLGVEMTDNGNPSGGCPADGLELIPLGWLWLRQLFHQRFQLYVLHQRFFHQRLQLLVRLPRGDLEPCRPGRSMDSLLQCLHGRLGVGFGRRLASNGACNVRQQVSHLYHCAIIPRPTLAAELRNGVQGKGLLGQLSLQVLASLARSPHLHTWS